MTVEELIEVLENFPSGMEIRVAHPSHDYWGTLLASEITEVEQGQTEYSAYHNNDKVIVDYMGEGDEDGEEDPDDKVILYLS